jgi:hypothetical protein
MWRHPFLLTLFGMAAWGAPKLGRAQPSTESGTKLSAPTVASSSFTPGEHSGALPWGISHVGVLWINGHGGLDTPVIESSGMLRASRWNVGFVLSHAPWSLHSHTRIENGYRLWGALAQRAMSELGASHATLSMDFDNARYHETSTSTTSLELRLSSRLDLKLLAPGLRSLFIDADVGYAGRRAAQRTSPATEDIKLLQFGLGLGMYLGDPTTDGNELKVRYTRDFKSYCEKPAVTPAQLTAPKGCAGFELWHFLSPSWGLRGQYEVGQLGWVLGLHLVGRAWSESAESNGIFDFGQ